MTLMCSFRVCQLSPPSFPAFPARCVIMASPVIAASAVAAPSAFPVLYLRNNNSDPACSVCDVRLDHEEILVCARDHSLLQHVDCLVNSTPADAKINIAIESFQALRLVR